MRLTETSDSRNSAGSRAACEGANGTGPAEFRAGGRVLSLFSTPPQGLVLRALANGPLRLADLRKRVGGPPQTTLRGHLGNLIEMGALEKRSREDKSGTVDNALTPAGEEMLFVAEALESWFSRCPNRTLNLENEAGKGAIKSLIGGWNSTMLRALAARPFSLTELDNLIAALTYPTLERRLSAMALAGQVVAMQSNDRGTPYAVTDWLRQGIAPILAAIHCEHCHFSVGAAPLARIDVEAILLLAMPLVALPSSVSGTCQLTIENRSDDSKWREAGVSAEIGRGEIVALSSKLESSPATSTQGSVADWFDAIVHGNTARMSIDGDRDLALGLVNGLHGALFAAAPGVPTGGIGRR